MSFYSVPRIKMNVRWTLGYLGGLEEHMNDKCRTRAKYPFQRINFILTLTIKKFRFMDSSFVL